MQPLPSIYKKKWFNITFHSSSSALWCERGDRFRHFISISAYFMYV